MKPGNLSNQVPIPAAREGDFIPRLDDERKRIVFKSALPVLEERSFFA